MTVYWLTYSVLGFFALLSTDRKLKDRDFFKNHFNISTIFIFIIFTLLIGFRYEVGGDWRNYLNLFFLQGERTFNLIDIVAADPGFVFLNYISYEFNFGFFGLNFLCSIIFMYGVLKFCRFMPMPIMALLVAFPYLIITVGMGYQRQSLAIGIILLALISLFKGENLKFLLMVTLAATFHKTAILFYPLLIFTASKNKFLISMFVSAIIVLGYFLLVDSRIEFIIDNYVGRKISSSGAIFRIVMSIIPAIIYLYYRSAFDITSKERIFWDLLSISIFILFIGLIVLDVSTLIDRIALYTLPIQLFVFSHLPTKFKPKYRPVIKSAIITYYALVLFVWGYFGAHSSHWIPYDNVVFRILSGDTIYLGF